MIYGLGIDIVRVERMKEVVGKWGERFLHRVFTINEIAYCYEKKNPFLSLSVRFAAKEALIKAIGSAVAIPFTDIEVVSRENGKPVIQPRSKLEEFFKENSLCKIHLSLSHEKDYGLAFVVIEKESA